MADLAFRGFVETTLDALLIFEGCQRGLLPKISRRLQDFEKRELVISGAVFVFDEEETGIKRWTDGLTWSPSRTLGNFLVYRELDKKAALLQKTPVCPGGDAANGEEEDEGGSSGKSRLLGGLTSKADPVDDGSDPSRPGSSSAARRSVGDGGGSQQLDRARERALVGSLTSSYRFRSDGLVKKTISLNGLHLIGYYRIEDVTSGRLRTPSSHPELVSIEVSSAFLAPALFRIPPIVEVNPDGSLRYKGEADAPLSPLTRSGSSQGFPTPGLSQSRPASSDSSFMPGMLPTPGGGWDYTPTVPAPPGSPRRGAMSSFRASNRFDPYSSSRFSPTTAAFPASAAYPFPAVPLNTPPPPRNAFSPVGESSLASTNDGYFQSRTPPIDAAGLSVSAPMTEGWQGPRGGVYQPLPPPPSRGGVDAHPNSPSFYQPRRSTPYAPTTDAQSANTIFAYNPPPPPPASSALLQTSQYAHYRAPSIATGASAPQFSAYQPLQPHSQHQQLALTQAHQQRQYASPLPQPPPTAVESSLSPFATPPATSHAARPVYPHPAHSNHSQPASWHNSPATHWAPPPPRLGGPIQEPTSSLAQQATSLMSEVSPHSPAGAGADSQMQRQQQAAMQAAYASAASYGRAQHAQQGAWPATAQPPPQPQGQGEQAYPYIQRQHTPSGLVAAIANDEVVPASGHGLGVSAYGEIVPASSLPPEQQSSTAYHHMSFRHPMPSQPSVSLSSQHAYAAPPPNHLQQQRYDGGVSPLNQHLSGMLERDGERGSVNGGNTGWMSVKRETPGPGQQPVSPPTQHQEPYPPPPHSMPYDQPQLQQYARPGEHQAPVNHQQQPPYPQQQWWSTTNDSWQHSLRPDGQ
ncbi:cAMP-independent regulatory protein [Rhodotorula toruloides]|uniref:cAMP-independent regulatory protein n=1 Tax=Rhodotorula toruloides TaxID=5286 RepID=A0A511KPD8_RHOTO|nr:cAMP-independent regulatory protein [Rhodotorula toruloides]